jgi:hypothetical protein
MLVSKDLYALSDKIDIRNSTSSLEMSGVVVKVGSADSKFVPGDRVVVMAPSNFGTVECVPEWACCRLNDGEDLTVCSLKSLPVPNLLTLKGDVHDSARFLNCAIRTRESCSSKKGPGNYT